MPEEILPLGVQADSRLIVALTDPIPEHITARGWTHVEVVECYHRPGSVLRMKFRPGSLDGEEWVPDPYVSEVSREARGEELDAILALAEGEDYGLQPLDLCLGAALKYFWGIERGE